MKFEPNIITIKNMANPQVYYIPQSNSLEIFVWQKDGMYQRIYSCNKNKIRFISKQKIGTYSYAKRINQTHVVVCDAAEVKIISLPLDI